VSGGIADRISDAPSGVRRPDPRRGRPIEAILEEVPGGAERHDLVGDLRRDGARHQQQRRRSPAVADHLQRPDRREPRHGVVTDHEVRAGQLAPEAGLVLDPLPLDGVPRVLHRERDQPGIVGVVIYDQQPQAHRVPLPGEESDMAVDRSWRSCRAAVSVVHKMILT
jgi:hypothetical protein